MKTPSLLRTSLLVGMSSSLLCFYAGASPSLDTYVTRQDGKYNSSQLFYPHHTNSTAPGSISDTAPFGYWSTVSSTASYGSASVSGGFSIPAFLHTEDAASAGDSGDALWTDTYNFSTADPLVQNGQGIAHFTFALSGSISASPGIPLEWGNNYADATVNGGNVAKVGYDWFVQNQYDPVLSHYSAIAVDVPFTFGSNFDMSGELSGSIIASNLSGNSSGASFHMNLSFRVVNFTVTNTSGAPVSYSMGSYAGTGTGWTISNGTTFAGKTTTNTAAGQRGTTVALLGGSANTDSVVNANFLADVAGFAQASDTVDVSGMHGEKFVLQISYDPTKAQNLFGSEANAVLLWLDPTTGFFENAVFGNSDGGAQSQEILGAYDGANDFVLGDYGVDTANHVVWAVVDHNSEFVVGQPTPEPGTWMLLASGLGVLSCWRRRRVS